MIQLFSCYSSKQSPSLICAHLKKSSLKNKDHVLLSPKLRTQTLMYLNLKATKVNLRSYYKIGATHFWSYTTKSYFILIWDKVKSQKIYSSSLESPRTIQLRNRIYHKLCICLLLFTKEQCTSPYVNLFIKYNMVKWFLKVCFLEHWICMIGVTNKEVLW